MLRGCHHQEEKPRVALEGMSWGTLGEVTSAPKSSKIEPVAKENHAPSQGRRREKAAEHWPGKENKISMNNKRMSLLHLPFPAHLIAVLVPELSLPRVIQAQPGISQPRQLARLRRLRPPPRHLDRPQKSLRPTSPSSNYGSPPLRTRA